MLKKNLIGIVVVILMAAAFAGGFWVGKGGSNFSSGMPAFRTGTGAEQSPAEQMAPTSPSIGFTQTVAAAPVSDDSAENGQAQVPEMQTLTTAPEEGNSPEATQSMPAVVGGQSGTSQPEADAALPTMQPQTQDTADAAVVPASTTLPALYEFYGTAAPVAEVNVQSQQGGTIVALNGKEGDEVQKGDVLARFDDSEQRLQIENAKSSKITAELQLQQAEANLKAAQTNLERNQELFEEGLISQQSMDELRNTVESAQATVNTSLENVKQADTQIALQENTLGNFVVRAPISGIIDLKNYNLQEIYTSDVLFHIMNIEQVYVNVDVPETYIKQVREGMQVTVSFNALADQAFVGVVETILPSGSTSNRTFTVKVLVENPDQVIKPGMFANVNMAFTEA